MRELPQNPNTRKPYSDVYSELEYYVGQIVGYLNIGRKPTESEWKELKRQLQRLDQAMLRARAVLDPVTLSEEEWERAAEHTAFDLFEKKEEDNDLPSAKCDRGQ